jgi:hypothetical protein
MFLRLPPVITVIVALFTLSVTACSKNMAVNVRPPECTVDEKTDCSTVRREPNAMMEEPFFQREEN